MMRRGNANTVVISTPKTYHYIHECMFFTVYTCRVLCECSSAGPFGGQEGTFFVDIPTDPCDVEITDIWIRHGAIVDAIRVRYRFPDGSVETSPRHGGGGGEPAHIPVPPGGKVIGIIGGTTFFIHNGPTGGTVISQLRVAVLDNNNVLQIFGPYGTNLNDGSGTFAVLGDIKSFFGYSGQYLDGLGVYYEAWGPCTTPCV